MPTNSKTSLGLNSWLGTDKPKRSDFVADNTLLDTLLTGHFSDLSKHLSAADRTLLTQGFAVGTYTGNGQATQVITLPFEARLVIVFCQYRPANLYRTSGGYNENNFAVVSKSGSTMGVSLSAAKLTVTQTQSTPSAGGTLNNFNSSIDDYTYIAFR